jgi:Transport and Golgi organisation 2
VCTAILDLAPGGPLLLAGVRDELVDRAWQPPGRHWPDHPDLYGGRDLQAGGTWLAVASGKPRVTCILNGRGRPAAPAVRRTRGVLPLQVADDGRLSRAGLRDFDPFHLISAEPGRALLWSWDGERLAERELPPGLHAVVNSGLDSDLLGRDRPGGDWPGRDWPGWGETGQAGRARDGRDHELARLAHFLPRLRAATRPRPRPGGPAGQAWGAWLPLINGDGLSPEDPRALVVRRDLGAGRVWGTTSISLVALWPGPVRHDTVRYDFNASPAFKDARADPGAWHEVSLGG